MFYKLRNNACINTDKENNKSIFVVVRTACSEGILYEGAITHEAQDLNSIANKLGGLKPAVEDELKILEDYGFVISGQTIDELNAKEIALYR